MTNTTDDMEWGAGLLETYLDEDDLYEQMERLNIEIRQLYLRIQILEENYSRLRMNELKENKND